MNSIVRICRLCLETISGNDCDAIEEITSRMLENLLLKVDLSLSEDPLICKTCAVDLDKSINFKTICLSRDSLDFEECKTESLTESHNSCRFCMKQIEIDCCIYLNDTKENVFIAEVMQTHIPELELNLAKEVNACKSCFGAMQDFSSFVTKCLNMEDTINTYAKSSSVALGQINLCDVQQLIFKSTIKCEASCSDENSSESVYSEGGDIDLKVDIKREEYAEVSNLDLSIKSEEIDIKPEHCESERFQATSILAGIKGSLDISVDKLQRRDTKIIDQHKGIIYKCEACLYETKCKKYMKRHKLVHARKTFKCDLCPYKTNYKQNVLKHRLRHKGTSETTMFQCKLCEFETKHKQSLLKHKSRHTSTSEIAMFKCKTCLFEAKRLYVLERHELIHKGTSEGTIFKCEACPFETRYKRNHAEHKLTHNSASEITMFKCDLCPFEAKRKRNLTIHKLSHGSTLQKTTLKCELCPLELRDKCNMKQHQLSHESASKTTFKCEQCSFETKLWCYLRRHKKIHNPEVMFKCDQCPHETKHKQCLNRHKLGHKEAAEMKMFECEQCPYATKRRDHLKIHELKHKTASDVTMFKCHLCPYETKRLDHLKLHISRHKTTDNI